MDKLLDRVNDAVEVNLGNIRFSVLTSIRGAIAGSLLFWLGAVEYRFSGIDDGKNKHGSPVLFRVWNALKSAGIEMPCPRRVVELRNPAA